MRRFAALAAIVAVSAVLFTAVSPSAQPAPAQAADATASIDPAAVAARVAPEPRGRSIVVAEPTAAPTEAPALETPAPPTPEPAAPSAVPVLGAAPVVAAAPQQCPSSFLCYPRLGISGAIIPYDDCSGKSEVGTSIRQLLCVRQGIWLAGHAYTQFGRITGFRVGDVVLVRGQRFEITASSVQQACAPTTRPVAPLSLQTSLDSLACGRVLVVEGR